MPAKDSSKTHKPSHLKDLLLLFAIPIAIAVIAAVVVYVPRLLAKPQYDFIYATCPGYGCQYNYSVDSAGHISLDDVEPFNRSDKTASLRYYDASTDSTRSLTVGEAMQYRLNTSSRSPDGYTLAREEMSGGFLFWGDYDQGWYLKNGLKKKEVALATTTSYYFSDQLEFLGWVNK